MASYDLKAILGERLKRLTDKTLKALVDCMCTVGASLCSLDKRVSTLESVELPEGGYKPMQEPVASPSASGTAIQFIESISQDATGRMTAIKKTVQDGTTSQKGVVQLEDSHSSTSTTKAATPKSVKEAYDLANTANTGFANKLDKTGDGKDVTVTFTEASTRENIGTGEKLSVMFGKIKKWFTDLKALAFKDAVSDSDIRGTISNDHIASASTWNGKADKASSGNGMLAVIDSNGNFASSGITAYNQSQLNSRVEGRVFPALQDSSFVREKDFIEWYGSENEYFFLDFENEYDSDQYLRLGLLFTGRYLAFRLPTGSAFNQWIFDGQTQGDSPVGLVEMYTSVIKNTNGNISTNVIRSSPYLDIFYEGGAVKPAVDFGSIDLGATSTAYASDSSVQIVMNVRNRLSGKMITISLTFGFTRFAAGSVYTGFIVGTAKVVAYNFNGIEE